MLGKRIKDIIMLSRYKTTPFSTFIPKAYIYLDGFAPFGLIDTEEFILRDWTMKVSY